MAANLPAAARILAQVYAKMPAAAVPPKVVPPSLRGMDSDLLAAIFTTVDSPGRPHDIRAQAQAYCDAYHLVVPRIRLEAGKAAVDLLDQQFRMLRVLDGRLGRPGVPDRLHDVAVQ